MKIIAIDPSINNCGYAIFENKNKKLIDYGLLNPRRDSKSYMEKSRDIAVFIDMKVQENFVEKMIIEKPMVYKTYVGYAATESESIQKLYFCVGVICGKVTWKAKQVLVSAMTWKGQLPKEITVRRVNKKYKVHLSHSNVTNNIADAIGIGDWYLNWIQNKGRKL